MFRSRVGLLDGEAEDAGDDVHRLVLPPDRAAAVCAVVPVAGTCRVQPRACFLQNHHRYCSRPARDGRQKDKIGLQTEPRRHTVL